MTTLPSASDPIWKRELNERKDEWEDKIRASSPQHWGHGHFRRTIEILHGDPPKQALLECANYWQSVPFNGTIERREYRLTDECGQLHRYVDVKVYTD